jgi:hypothetical protein
MRNWIFWLSIVSIQWATAQEQQGRLLPIIVEGDDTIFVASLPPANISEFGSAMSEQEYYRLRFNVLKVYPYARLAKVKLREMNDHVQSLTTNRERKKYQKEFEARLKEDFESQMKKLSVNQGKVLMKLLQRETGQTAYHLVQNMQGGLSAFFWQSAAKLWGHDLKEPYEPTGKDQVIESIVQQIERGELQ